MYLLYDIGVRILAVVLAFISIFNKKINLFVKGRRHTFSLLESAIGQNDKSIWFHCASLGEFEQGRPLLEQISKEHPEYKIILSFFSPSGYEVQKNYSLADVV